MPESLSVEKRADFELGDINPFKQVTVLFRTTTFRRIAACAFLMTLYTDGLMQTNGLFSRGYLELTEGQNAGAIVSTVVLSYVL